MITIQSDLVGQLRAQTFCVAASDTSVSNKHITTRALFTALMLIFVGIFGASAQVVQPAWITNGLLAYYPFNGNSKDLSGNSRALTEHSVTYGVDRFGSTNSSLHIGNKNSGSASYLSGSGFGSAPLTNFSVTFWANMEPSYTTQAEYAFAAGIESDRRFSIRIINDDIVSVELNAGGRYYDTYSYHNPTYLDGIGRDLFNPATGWKHYLLVYDGASLVFYKNGEAFKLKDRITPSFAVSGAFVPSDTYPLMVGKGFSDLIEAGIGGLLDDLRLYNRALSPTEVQALYSYESLPNTQPPRVATASSQVVNGFVVGATIIDGGQGYTNAPRVNFVGGGGSGATATATIDANGSVTAISIRNTGSGYTNSPLVVIDPPPFPPKSAYATATVVNGFVVGVSITNGGYGYGSSPSIHFIGGGGSGASAAANINELGVVTNVTIITVGSGYTNAPEVVIAPPIVPAPALKVGLAQTLTFTGLNNEKTYELQALDGQSFVSTGTTATPQSGTYVTSVDNPAAYRLVVQPVPRTATASLQVVNGFVVGAAVVTGGSGYTAPPAVNIVDGTGSGASVAAVLNSGSVAGFVVNSVGHNYSSNAVAIVVSPPVVGITPTASPSLRMTASHLLPYFAYQLQTSTNLITFQTDGDLIFATNSTQVLYYPIRNSVGFGKLVYVR